MQPATDPSRPPEAIEAGPATLRRWRACDLDELYTAVEESEDHLRPWMPWAENANRDGNARFLAESESNWDAGAEFNYSIRLGDKVVGSAGLMKRRGPGTLEIGYWVHQAYTRRGLATAASAALTDHAFRLPGIERVEIMHDELNTASRGVPYKLGFTEVGRSEMENPPAAGTGIGVLWRVTKDAWTGAR